MSLILNMYKCNHCKYETKYKCNLIKHQKTKNHEDIFLEHTEEYHNISETYEQSKYTCCGITFGHASSYSRHKKKCKKVNTEDTLTGTNDKSDMSFFKEQFFKMQETINKLIEENKSQSKETLSLVISQADKAITQADKTIDVVRQENEYHKTLVNSAGTLVNNTVNQSLSTANYIIKNYTNAPLFEVITDFSSIGDGVENLVDLLVYSFNNKTLHSFVGDYIVSKYKKDNPHEQSIWSTDTERYNYFRRLLSDGKPQWIADKAGFKTREEIVGPLLNYLKDILHEALAGILPEQYEKEYLRMGKISKIIQEINNKSLEQSVIKYIANPLHANRQMVREGKLLTDSSGTISSKHLNNQSNKKKTIKKLPAKQLPEITANDPNNNTINDDLQIVPENKLTDNDDIFECPKEEIIDKIIDEPTDKPKKMNPFEELESLQPKKLTDLDIPEPPRPKKKTLGKPVACPLPKLDYASIIKPKKSPNKSSQRKTIRVKTKSDGNK